MDKIIIPASITLESSNLNRKYKWKSDSGRESVYKINSKRAFIRFSCKKFSYNLNKLSKNNRFVSINFLDISNVILKRIKKDGRTLQGYGGKHLYLQVIVNGVLPNQLKNKFCEQTRTYPLDVHLDLDEWKDTGISPEDFLIDVEKDAKSLMRKALESGFTIERASKGRMFDLQLITPSKKELIIALSSHVAKTQNRSKEKRIQKILMDISKMIPYLWNRKDVIPIIVSQPIETKDSWSYTTNSYIDFYKDNFGFKFITTEFKKGWENDIIREMLII